MGLRNRHVRHECSNYLRLQRRHDHFHRHRQHHHLQAKSTIAGLVFLFLFHHDTRSKEILRFSRPGGTRGFRSCTWPSWQHSSSRDPKTHRKGGIPVLAKHSMMAENWIYGTPVAGTQEWQHRNQPYGYESAPKWWTWTFAALKDSFRLDFRLHLWETMLTLSVLAN